MVGPTSPFGDSPFLGQAPESIVAHLSQQIDNLDPTTIQATIDAAQTALAAQNAAPAAILKGVLSVVLGVIGGGLKL